MLVYILCLSWQWMLLVLILVLLLVLVLFLIWFSFKFSSPKLVISLFVGFLLIALVINAYLPGLQKKPRPISLLGKTDISSPEGIPPSGSAHKIFPAPNKCFSLRIEGIEEKQFIVELAKQLGYNFSQEGDFLIAISFDGNIFGTNNEELGKEVFNYQEGSLLISVAGKTCIRAGELIIAASNYQGLNRKELLLKLEENKLALLQKQLEFVVQKIKNCIPT